MNTASNLQRIFGPAYGLIDMFAVTRMTLCSAGHIIGGDAESQKKFQDDLARELYQVSLPDVEPITMPWTLKSICFET